MNVQVRVIRGRWLELLPSAFNCLSSPGNNQTNLDGGILTKRQSQEEEEKDRDCSTIQGTRDVTIKCNA